ncbi:hypothetical protein PsorP6_004643 [Peronosclerospora sorghi]|uniref:Uncharacterized protein n=1 Tax=Peronosclerospora sorghi TaxID=230839 RepID=A0ACC0VM88_9STRA|nr:hypothetical protein PsorP6_004643 [Peronosclerospora sorghi]
MALMKYVTFQCMVTSSVNTAYRVSPVANHPSLSRFSSFASVVNTSFLAISSSKIELLEVMMRAQEGILDISAIRQINWVVHLGDMVTVRGVLQRKHSEAIYSNGWLLDLVSISVDEPWCFHHTGTVFNYTVSDVAPPTTLLW